MAEKPVRSRMWNAILYPEDPTQAAAFEYIQQNLDYCAALHDMDSDENGVQKKSHWHVILNFENARTASAVAKELNIKDNYLRPQRSWTNSARYLIHRGWDEKFQYSEDAIFGSLAHKALQSIRAKEDEGGRVMALMDVLDSTPGFLSYAAAMKLACANGVYDVFRRIGGYGMKMILDEHNVVYTRGKEDCETP